MAETKMLLTHENAQLVRRVKIELQDIAGRVVSMNDAVGEACRYWLDSFAAEQTGQSEQRLGELKLVGRHASDA